MQQPQQLYRLYEEQARSWEMDDHRSILYIEATILTKRCKKPKRELGMCIADIGIEGYEVPCFHCAGNMGQASRMRFAEIAVIDGTSFHRTASTLHDASGATALNRKL